MEAMDLGDDAEDVSGDAVAGLDDVLDDAAFENEACGICMDTVIDRGVLDCCSHWFCFACIDNWATITSLCPICKKEFQLITCLPVYDTISNFKVDEHLLSRGDDWYIQGKNNTLSFPSYYINEDAVICLDGDGCKIRSKLSTEEDLIFDTSIACDSCDIWYHAFCVGFDPECTLENSWLCPRCVDDALPQNLDNNSVQNPIDHYDPTNAGSGQSVDSAFSGKVSISIADAGETAVVVSMLEGTQLTRSAERGQVESELATNTGVAMEAVMANIDTCNTEFEQCVYRNCVDDGDDRSAAGDQGHFEFPLGLSSERSIISSNSLVQESFSGSSPSIEALTDRPATPSNDSELGMSFGLSVSEGGPSVCDVAKVQAVGDSAQHSNDVFSLSADKFIKNGDENVAPLPNHKNVSGHTEILSSQLMKDSYTSGQLKKRGRDSHAKPATEVCSTKDKLDERFHMVPQRRRIDTSVAMIPEGFSGMTSPKDSELKHASEMENRTSDIMTIVQDDREFSKKRLSDERNSQKSTNVRQSGVGLRMKKIMWRVGDDKESSLLVQKLRNEIRETVCGKELSDFSQDGAFDGELLSAFRAAIAKPTNKPVGKVDSSLARGKKHLLQKGKVRENLSKKIYGTASGRRRRAWDRDRVVEFWKHRCTSIKPEKVETLQSVLDLLKKIKSSHVNCEIEQGFEMEATNSILSRVYLADTSVLPRQEDIKPLSALTGHFMVSTLEHQNLDKFSSSLDTNLSKNIVRTDDKSSSDSSQGVVALYDKKVMIDGSNFMMGGRSCISAPRHSEGGEKTLKEPLVCSGSARCDKRNWALEVLARKNALTSRETSQRNEEDNSLLKETYPLLAQLPVEMRPVPAPSHHNKVPMQVRQAQLYRLTEHYLRRANVPVICITADVELAVADAINVEKEICERSKSKLVYMNLCSQHIIHTKPPKEETVVSNPTRSPAQSIEQEPNEAMSYPALGHDGVEEALRQAGLLSDSPPNSPPQSTTCFNEEVNSLVAGEGDLENLLNMDSHPDIDIYGDFDYDLDDGGYGGPSNLSSCLRECKLQNEDGDSKMKVVLSTASCERLINSPDPKNDRTNVPSHGKEQAPNELDKPRTAEADSCTLSKHWNDKAVCQPMLTTINDTCYPMTESLDDKRYAEPSWMVCKELHGPEKEVLERPIYAEVTDSTAENMTLACNENDTLKNEAIASGGDHENCSGVTLAGSILPANQKSSERENSPGNSLASISGNKPPESNNSVSKKVEVYIKEHIRPLCKSGVITVEQYRWAVGKATEKVMKYHCKAKSASFLIKEGNKVKKLAEEYVEASQRKEWKCKLH